MKHIIKAKNIIKIVIFILVLVASVQLLESRLFKISDARSHQTFKGFYSEKKDSLDAVYVGQSNVYPFWSAPLAWEDFGYAVYPLAVGDMPCRSIKYVVEEGLKTQSKALYMINLNCFLDVEIRAAHIHNVTDYMNFNKTKFALINDALPYIEDADYDKLEFLFPIVRFHTSWNELKSTSFNYRYNGLKGGSTYSNFLSTIDDQSERFSVTDGRVKLPEGQEEILNDLMNYLEEKGVEALFVTVPTSNANESLVAQLNYAEDVVKERGYEVLNLFNHMDDMGINLKSDYYNALHFNVHGSIKFTDFVSKYLGERYGFEDKRGKPEYKSWDEAIAGYHEEIDPFTLDIEFDTEQRDYTLKAPKISRLTATGQSFYLAWEEPEEDEYHADGYLIYRKQIEKNDEGKESSDTSWEKIADVGSETRSYVDENLKLFKVYRYVVVPYVGNGTNIKYGEINMVGAEGETRINPPEIVSFENTESGNRIRWNPVEGVDGYAVVRRLENKDGQKFEMIAELDPETLEYTDSLYQEDQTYTYSVRGFKEYSDKKADRKYGYYNPNGPTYGDGVADSEGEED